jgi:hypothetical protein
MRNGKPENNLRLLGFGDGLSFTSISKAMRFTYLGLLPLPVRERKKNHGVSGAPR